jgi:hypothetical protein
MKNFLSSLPFTSAAKAAAGFVALTARLKPRPFKTIYGAAESHALSKLWLRSEFSAIC